MYNYLHIIVSLFVDYFIFCLLRRHQIVIVVFSDVDTALAASSDSDMYSNSISSLNEAYTRVTDGEVAVAAYVAIELNDSDWPSDGMFTIGEDTTSATSNQPLRTGFAYRAFIIAYPLNV